MNSFTLRSCIYVHALNQVWKKTATPRRWRRSRRCWTRRSSCKPWTPLEVSPLSGGSSNLFGRMRMTFSSSFIVSSSSQEIIYIYQPAYMSLSLWQRPQPPSLNPKIWISKRKSLHWLSIVYWLTWLSTDRFSTTAVHWGYLITCGHYWKLHLLMRPLYLWENWQSFILISLYWKSIKVSIL